MPADEDATGPLDDLTQWLGRSGRVVTSPARRCRQPGGEVEPLLRPWDLGAWTGRSLAELDLAAWRSDPAYDAHGGESLLALLDRVRDMLGQWHDQQGRLVAVTHAAVIKAAVVNVLGAPPTATWDIDVHPGSGTEIHAGPGGWRAVRVNAPCITPGLHVERRQRPRADGGPIVPGKTAEQPGQHEGAGEERAADLNRSRPQARPTARTALMRWVRRCPRW